MARRKAKKVTAKEQQDDNGPRWPESDNGLPLVTTTRGVTLECQAVAMELSSRESRINRSVTWPDAPTYMAHFGGPGEEGDDIETPYDDESIQDAPPEDQEKWEAYIDELTRVQADLHQKLSIARTRFFAIEGVKVVGGAPTLEEWAARQLFIGGVEVTADPLEQQVEHFLECCLGNPAVDLLNIYLGVSMASGADKARLEALEDMFRTQIQEAQSTAWRHVLEPGPGDTGTEEQADMGG